MLLSPPFRHMGETVFLMRPSVFIKILLPKEELE
jgi:hypothetical protein